ncbi:alpha/beta hydrolase [Psychroserpens sp.]|uniref:alpha/beta hydrolase n=1 Tax=Psychroserpens sp. TaxID=2020870 RepID=UPI001B0A409E|nr:alpha/beta hydrolase [Psychroserpens sp.]MBO6607451.1 alpha/beta hydrolase [Psychroserpens sp.]MBO6631770.1 alpha/beta hydrolase [Psychroserpens sp.]MBO6654471.1 alpha/beta hydrolase [Psychroserpens sp.]MBO6681180.1 alpha/beta hydrolase [Psychroserpens sp.]MBO6749863.1 alpha/beta hydrolase [Psychroserpens sp.]
MKFIKNTFLLLFLTVGFVSCSDDDSNGLDPNALEFRQELNVSYGTDPDQVFDIYLPANRTLDTKIMILVHGGGWTSGDKSSMNILKDLILQEIPDVAIVNINYRLADQNNPPFPMQIDDISAIVSYLKDQQSTYVISDDIGFIGTSAGAHLSMLWSYAHDDNAATNMVASIVGPTNFTDPAYLNNTNPELQEIIDIYGIDASIEFLELVSPYHQVTIDAPPTILFYGGQDPLIPTSQGVDMQARLETLGVTHQFILYPNAGHGWIGSEFIDTWTNLKAFIGSHL